MDNDDTKVMGEPSSEIEVNTPVSEESNLLKYARPDLPGLGSQISWLTDRTTDTLSVVDAIHYPVWSGSFTVSTVSNEKAGAFIFNDGWYPSVVNNLNRRVFVTYLYTCTGTFTGIIRLEKAGVIVSPTSKSVTTPGVNILAFTTQTTGLNSLAGYDIRVIGTGGTGSITLYAVDIQVQYS